MIKVKQISDLESTIQGTSRSYTAGQAMEVIHLIPDQAGSVTPVLSSGNKLFCEMNGDTAVLHPPVVRGQDISILFCNKGGGVLSFQEGYRVLGDVPSTTPDDYILVNISFFGDGKPWVVINNQPS